MKYVPVLIAAVGVAALLAVAQYGDTGAWFDRPNFVNGFKINGVPVTKSAAELNAAAANTNLLNVSNRLAATAAGLTVVSNQAAATAANLTDVSNRVAGAEAIAAGGPEGATNYLLNTLGTTDKVVIVNGKILSWTTLE